MQTEFYEENIEEDYIRTVYNTFIFYKYKLISCNYLSNVILL